MTISAFNAKHRVMKLADDYGATLTRPGGGTWLHVAFPGERAKVFKRGWIAMYEHLVVECETRVKPVKKRKPAKPPMSRRGRKPVRLPGVRVQVEAPRDSGTWRQAVLLQRDPFVSRVTEEGAFYGLTTKAQPRLAKEASHATVQQERAHDHRGNRHGETPLEEPRAKATGKRGDEVRSGDCSTSV